MTSAPTSGTAADAPEPARFHRSKRALKWDQLSCASDKGDLCSYTHLAEGRAGNANSSRTDPLLRASFWGRGAAVYTKFRLNCIRHGAAIRVTSFTGKMGGHKAGAGPRRGVCLQLLGVSFFAAAVVHTAVVWAQAASPTTVTCTTAAGDTATQQVTLTPASPAATLVCKLGSAGSGSVASVPANFNGEQVCQTGTLKTKTCTQVAFSSIFPQADSASWWTTKTLTTTAGAKLTIPAGSFPRYDQNFYLGCVDDSGAQTCVITVTVKANNGKQDGQKVTCAYNASATYPVTLTKTAPKLIIDCGPNGVAHPTGGFNKGACSQAVSTSQACSPPLAYSSVFTSFQEDWWESASGVYTLTVPDGSFPTAKKSFFLACSGPAGTGGVNNYCNVAVTVDPSASSGGGGAGSGGGTVTTTTTKSDAYTGSDKAIGFVALAAVAGFACLAV